ncbi:hypothetical protein BS50DRAFT_330125 [Corynespora cassiicola Philippines]|uniref:Uncharacterized protein n=1 Tax=Corynespora cassiicola Philippines TaxID=1448308 RepID=A0A2T2NUB4_CORCC|nr:hypothetical protein BS50DRAFT_330125 [Corynespora cassiicola Philippines]
MSSIGPRPVALSPLRRASLHHSTPLGCRGSDSRCNVELGPSSGSRPCNSPPCVGCGGRGKMHLLPSRLARHRSFAADTAAALSHSFTMTAVALLIS